MVEQTSSRTWKKRIKILLNQVISEIAYFVCSWGKCQSGRSQGVKRSKAEKEVYFMPITRFGKNVHPRVKFFESTSLNWQFLQFFLYKSLFESPNCRYTIIFLVLCFPSYIQIIAIKCLHFRQLCSTTTTTSKYSKHYPKRYREPKKSKNKA